MADEKTKLEKVNDRLYHEPRKDGEPIKWERQYHRIYVDLTECAPSLMLSIERPETDLRRRQVKEAYKELEKDYPQEFQEVLCLQKVTEAYSQKLEWMIDGKGKLAFDARIGIIYKNGNVSPSRDHFTTANHIRLRPVPDSDKEKEFGIAWHDVPQYATDRQEESIRMELPVSKTEFDAFRDELLAGRLNKLDLAIDIESFQSENDAFFTRQTFFIEAEHFSTPASLSWLRASRPVVSPSAAVPEELIENPVALFAARGFHEEKINFFGKWLLGLPSAFNAKIEGLIKVVAYMVLVYFLVKGVVWLFQR
jgi:hypothetical protein